MSIAPGSDPLGVLEFLDGGNYLVMAKVQLDASGDLPSQVTVESTLEAGDTIDRSAVRLASEGVATLPLSAPASLSGPGTAVLRCEVPAGFDVLASRVKLTANKVDSLDFQP